MKDTINQITYGEIERLLHHLESALEIRWQHQLKAVDFIYRIKQDLEIIEAKQRKEPPARKV